MTGKLGGRTNVARPVGGPVPGASQGGIRPARDIWVYDPVSGDLYPATQPTGDVILDPGNDFDMQTGRDFNLISSNDTNITASGDLNQEAAGDVNIRSTGAHVRIRSLPTSDPGITGALYTLAGVLHVSP